MRKVFIAILLAIILAAGTGTTGAGKENSKIKALFQPMDTEARTYLANRPTLSSEDLHAYALYLVEKYERNLTSIIHELEHIEKVSLPKDGEEDLKLLIVTEHLHRIMQENIPGIGNAAVLTVEPVLSETYSDGTTAYQVFFTPMGNIPYPIYYWVQVYPDVYGGSGYDDAGKYYNVNGGNNLYLVVAEYTSTWVKYTLYFYDEDHPDPVMDALYDGWRRLWYGRIEDIESFTVQNSTISFSGIWDNNMTYAEWWGQHGNMTRSYRTYVYVSNVWNHAMDTYDKNPSMGKIWWYTAW